MNFKKLFIGGIAGGILYFLLGWLFYGILLVDFMKNNQGATGNIERVEPDMVFLVIGNMAMGFLLAYVFIKSNIRSLAGGLVMGGIIGLLLCVGMDCVMYATTTIISKKGMAADVATFTVMSAVAGALVGLIMGMGKKTA